MIFGLEQEGGSLITPMALAHPLHPIDNRSRNKRRNLWNHLETDDVFPPDDHGSCPEALCWYICIYICTYIRNTNLSSSLRLLKSPYTLSILSYIHSLASLLIIHWQAKCSSSSITVHWEQSRASMVFLGRSCLPRSISSKCELARRHERATQCLCSLIR